MVFWIMHFLENYLHDEPDVYDSLNLFVSTFSQIETGGLHGLSDGYEIIDDLIATGPAT